MNEIEDRLAKTYQKLVDLGLPRHPALKPGLKTLGGLVKKRSYLLDSYIGHKTLAGDAVSMCVVQERDHEPVLLVHRRRIDPVTAKMVTVGVDTLPVEKYALAENLFLTTATLITEVPKGWMSTHPVEDEPA